MSCHPGTPCYNYGGTVVYPRGCGIDPCTAFKTGTDLVFYNGANLPCSGVNTCDSLTVALQKFDEKVCPEAIAQALFSALSNNLSLRNMFCTFVNNCISTTTSTTTAIIS